MYRILILGDNTWNAPFWMLRSVFFGSLLVYTLTMAYGIIPWRAFRVSFILTILAVAYVLFGMIACMVVLGAVIYWGTEEYFYLLKRISNCVWLSVFIVSLIMVYGFHHMLYTFISRFILLHQALDYEIAGRMLYSTTMFIAVVQSTVLQKIFSSKPLVWLGNISYPVFLIHWPLMCSLSAGLLCRESGNYVMAFWGVLAETTVVLLTLSLLFNRTVKKYSAVICGKLK